MAYNPLGYGPTPDEELKLAQAKNIEAQAIAQGQLNFERGGEKIGVSPPGPMNAKFDPILPKDTAQTNKLNAETDAIRKNMAWQDAANIRHGYKNGGPVIKGEFKHANPTYVKFGQTGDSNLLAKGRK